jgi:hypothetical protein
MDDTTAVEAIEIIELDDRLDMAADPMVPMDTNTCCHNYSCTCPPAKPSPY